MKILFPVGSFYPTKIGGPGTILYWHGVYLKKNNFNPTFITTTVGIKTIVTANQFLNMPCGKVYYGKGGVLNLSTIRKMLAEVKKSDIIHLTSLFSPISIICFLYTNLFYRKAKIIWSVRGELNINALAIGKSRKKFMLKLYKLLAKKVVFASTSAKETEEIKAIFKNKVIEIPNLMPISNKLKRTDANKRFLFLGRIHPIKNIESLINGFFNSQAFKDKTTFLDIAGDYELRNFDYIKRLKKLVDKNNLNHKVVFLGHIQGNEKEQLLANAYFLVLPSHSENFGNVVIESLIQGTPVIASKNTPWKELSDFGCGFWVDNSSKEIAEAIDKAFALSKDDYSYYRKQAIKLVKQKYTIEIRIQDWINEYKTLLK